jgi:hypothetical protein
VKYVFDTGAFIYLFKHYPRVTFGTLWSRFDGMIEDGEIISSSESLKELQAIDDQIARWAKNQKKLFVKPDEDELAVVRQILIKHPELLKQKSINIGNPEADPFLIAQAKCRDIPLVTTEQFKNGGHKIPNVCKDFKVKCLYIFEFYAEEGWNF